MSGTGCYARGLGVFANLVGLTVTVPAQTPPQAPAGPTRADILRGEYGPYRANNDLLSYHLDIRLDPEKKFISGKNVHGTSRQFALVQTYGCAAESNPVLLYRSAIHPFGRAAA